MKMEITKALPFCFILLACISTPAMADIGTVSRANCILDILNESITYDRPQFRPFFGTAVSEHLPQGNLNPSHILFSPSQLHHWRHYAGDAGDPEVMKVTGSHSWTLYDENYNLLEYGSRQTSTIDCSAEEW